MLPAFPPFFLPLAPAQFLDVLNRILKIRDIKNFRLKFECRLIDPIIFTCDIEMRGKYGMRVFR